MNRIGTINHGGKVGKVPKSPIFLPLVIVKVMSISVFSVIEKRIVTYSYLHFNAIFLLPNQRVHSNDILRINGRIIT